MTALHEGRIQPDVFDDDDILLPLLEHAPHAALRLPDGRAMAWAEYGSARGLPCVLIPDTGSSRLAPGWLLHDSALPSAIRLLAIDRPGIGVSDPIGFGGTEQPAEDLRRMVETLAVGRVAVIGIGQGADDAFAFAARYPALVTSVSAVSVRLPSGESAPPGHASAPAGTAGPGPARWPVVDPDRRQGRRPDRRGDLVADARPARPEVRRGARRPVDGVRLPGGRRRRCRADQPGLDGAGPRPGFPRVGARPGAVRVPVEVWHGRHETGTTLASVQEFSADLPGWTVRSAPGSSAVLGAWTDILGVAAAGFLGAN